jgi:hypothetical protein
MIKLIHLFTLSFVSDKQRLPLIRAIKRSVLFNAVVIRDNLCYKGPGPLRLSPPLTCLPLSRKFGNRYKRRLQFP